MKNIHIQGCYCYIHDHGLAIGEEYHCELSHIEFDSNANLGIDFKKIMLFIEAAKTSIATQKPFQLMFEIDDLSARHDSMWLYTCVVQFQPTELANSILVSVSENIDSSYSILGYLPQHNATTFLDALYQDFLMLCREITNARTPSHRL